ncbi:MAG: 30S ribosomal protein S7 [Candidatus Brockarchaeota archaeon]|nr:30S ribosomal protein S7 [Candidatus Brockarchaeota archaeon]MBO3808337.1 30S ribosomal protein S7 [Candidatus Brockarchaeota archaeon]
MAKTSVECKLFDKWDISGIEVRDPGLANVVSLRPVVIPYSGGRHEKRKFWKYSVNVVERLANRVAQTARAGGRKAKAINIVKHAFEIINIQTGRNPVEILVEAIVNSAPKEDTTRVSYGGIVYYQSVDISPGRRVDLAIRNIVDGAKRKSFKTRKSMAESLAEEIINAASNSEASFAVSRKIELERHAEASR